MADELKSLIEDAYDEGTLHPLFAAPVVQPDDSKDAERYRWLRADSRPAAWRLEYWVGYWECSTFGDDLDAAIDKAMAAEKE